MSTNIGDFGSDLSCVSDLTPQMLVVSGNRLVGEAVARRLQTPKGALLDDSNYGFDITALLNADVGQGDIGRIQAGITAECQKDQRILVANTTCVFRTATKQTSPSIPTGLGYLEITIAIITRLGPFTLVLAATQVTVSILQTGT